MNRQRTEGEEGAALRWLGRERDRVQCLNGEDAVEDARRRLSVHTLYTKKALAIERREWRSTRRRARVEATAETSLEVSPLAPFLITVIITAAVVVLIIAP